MNPKEIKVKGKKEFDISMALIEAGGSDNFRPPQSIVDKAFAKLGNGSGLALHLIEGRYVALRGNRGITIYTFLLPIKLV